MVGCHGMTYSTKFGSTNLRSIVPNSTGIWDLQHGFRINRARSPSSKIALQRLHTVNCFSHVENPPSSEAVVPTEKKEASKFVHNLRQASPFIEGHRGKTFVIVIPGEVIECKEVLNPLMEDVALLHGLGVKIVVVLGARPQINEAVRESGQEPTHTHGYRVTDAISLSAAIQAAGTARMLVEARLSKGPAVQMVRRHVADSGNILHYGPAVSTVSGNYVAAKRRGVVGGVDYGFTGQVRFVQADALKHQLRNGDVVLLNNLGYSAAGEVLNCDIYMVAARAAVDLRADKIMFLTLPSTQPLSLPSWIPLPDAQRLLKPLAATPSDSAEGSALVTSLPAQVASSTAGEHSHLSIPRGSDTGVKSLDFDSWYDSGLPLAVVAACNACQQGVKRAHLVDARTDGALLMELYSQDGVGTMISTDFYEGIRAAEPQDIVALQALLKPLEDKGILLGRSQEQLTAELHLFTVTCRESKVFGCAQLKSLGIDASGRRVTELAAFCIDPAFRGAGRGDSLLEYCEQEVRKQGVDRLVLLTTRTADWFEQRGFLPAGPAHMSTQLPEARRKLVNASRNAQLFIKDLIKVTGSMDATFRMNGNHSTIS